MFSLTARLWAVLAILVAVSAITGQEAAKSRYKIITHADLTKGREDEKVAYSTIFLGGLKRLGKEGWEVIGETERGLFARKGKDGEGWEYRIVRAPDSPLNGRSEDDEILQLVFDGLASQGWKLCLFRADPETRHDPIKHTNILLKRAFLIDDKKKEEAIAPNAAKKIGVVFPPLLDGGKTIVLPPLEIDPIPPIPPPLPPKIEPPRIQEVGKNDQATIRMVMQKTMKDGLTRKFAKGEATPDEKAQLIVLFTALAGCKCQKGDPKGWNERTAALLAAVTAGDSQGLAKAADCAGCHREHKGPR